MILESERTIQLWLPISQMTLVAVPLIMMRSCHSYKHSIQGGFNFKADYSALAKHFLSKQASHVQSLAFPNKVG